MNIRSSSPVAICYECGPIAWVVIEDIAKHDQRMCCGECGRAASDYFREDACDSANRPISAEFPRRPDGWSER
jgi:ribosomal protein S27AE